MAEHAEQMQLDEEDVNMDQAEAVAALADNPPRQQMEEEEGDADDNGAKNFSIAVAPFEIETYAAQFYCYGKILRLQFIAKHCPPLRIEALEHLVNFVKGNTFNVQLYEELCTELSDACKKEGRPGYAIDQDWVDRTNSSAKLFTDKLESELKNYKTNSIKESIRRGYSDLARHYLTCGDLTNAQRCYFRSRDYCMGDQQLLIACLAIARMSLYMDQRMQLQLFLSKTDMLSDLDPNHWTYSQLNCILGISDMLNGTYKKAAERFFSASFDHFSGENVCAVMSANCVAIYGTLCAMASFDRNDLKTLLFSNLNFKLFLELEPQLREAALKFYDSKYTQSLGLLADAEDAFRLDLYLSSHVAPLYSAIRSRALVLYFRPYMSANLVHMSTVFHTNLAQLESELLELIVQGKVEARIDSHRKILFAKGVDQRVCTFKRCLAFGPQWRQRTHASVLKAACIRHGEIFIQDDSPKRSKVLYSPGGGGNGGGSSGNNAYGQHREFFSKGGNNHRGDGPSDNQPSNFSSTTTTTEMDMDTTPSLPMLDESRARRMKAKCVKTTDEDQGIV